MPTKITAKTNASTLRPLTAIIIKMTAMQKSMMAVTRLIVFFYIIHPSSVHGSCHPIPFHAILIVPCFIIDCQPSRWYVKGDHSMEFEYKNPSLWQDLAEKDRDALFAYGERY